MSVLEWMAQADPVVEVRLPIVRYGQAAGELVLDIAEDDRLYAHVTGHARDLVRGDLHELEIDCRRVEVFPSLWLCRQRSRIVVSPCNIAVGSVSVKTLAVALIFLGRHHLS